MRWRASPEAGIGGTRERSAFLLLPKRIGSQWRWLERTRWVEKAQVTEGILGDVVEWKPTGWLADDRH